jgi:4-amino-4-deoxy-L-arabinose transferase-like glycosyltransferase
MTGLAARNGGRIGLAALIAILLLGLGLRVDYAWEGRAPVFDAVAYERIAANLERGEGFSLGANATQPASNYSPGLPLLAAGLHKARGGVHERFARMALALIGSLAVLFTYLIGRRLSGPTAGLIGAGIVAIYPALLEYQGMLMGEPLAVTLLSGAVLAMLWAAGENRDHLSRRWRGVWGPRPQPARTRIPAPRQDPRARWLVPGLLFGALALVRPEYLGVSLVVAVVVLAWHRDEWQPGVVNAAILLAGVALVLAPWTARNAIALDRFVPVSTGGGQVLFAGSYVPSGGDPERVGAEVLERHPGLARQLPSDARLEQILAALAAQRYPGMEADEALARMGRERLWDDLGERPLEYAGFVAAKVWRAWSHGPRQVMERPGWEAFHLALVGFGLLGLIVLARRRPPEALLLAVLLVAVTAIVALLVASPRRVLVTIPLVAALAGIGISWLTGLLAEGRLAGDRRGVPDA